MTRNSPESPITAGLLHELARRNGIVISPHHEKAYLLGIQSTYEIAEKVNALPDYIDPRLHPVPVMGGVRKYRKPEPEQNALNAWRYMMDVRAAKPQSQVLEGCCFALKDTIAVGNIPQSVGTFPQFLSDTGEYPCPQIDAIVVQRFLLAGATLAGISTCENYSLSPMSYTSAFGPVHNPWRRGYNSGGSSSGSAALVALGVARDAGVEGLEAAGTDVTVAIGGDQAGSIRAPASYCGIYGLKPTFGLVPYTGIAGLLPMIDYVGPMARTIEDIALSLTVMAGYDGLDPRMSPESPLRENVEQYHETVATFAAQVQHDRARPSAGPILRIGMITESFHIDGMSDEVAEVVRSAAIQHFTAMGAQVSEVSIPIHAVGAAIWTAAVRNQMASHAFGGRATDSLTHDLPHLSPRWPPDQEMYDLLSSHNPAVILTALGETLLTDSQLLPMSSQRKAHRHVLQLRAAYDEALQEFDVLVTPTTPTVAPPLPDLNDANATNDPSGLDSLILKMLRMAAGSTNNTSPFNATGHPALNVPCGWGTASNGVDTLPIGLQIIGKRYDDAGVLKAAKLFELGGGGLGTRPA